jgi:ubiquinol-cytochrome c reductase iron-sulfur subunit
MLATVGFIASFVAIPIDKIVYIWPAGRIGAQNFALGMTLGIALFCIGAGAVHWARTLMSDHELVDERHAVSAEPDVRAKVMEDFAEGAKESALGRRPLIRRTMFGALTLLPLSGVVLLRDLGPLPEDKLEHTLWSKGKLLVNENTHEPLRPEDISVGSLTFAWPEGLEEEDEEFQKEIAKAALMLVRLEPGDIKDKRELDWSHEGIVAYSKICTHVGCPVSLYEQQTHHVLCPCHQSTFDLSDGARVIFGPAGHPLPQLKISVNKDGFLEAQGDFAEPVGPAYWERRA